MEKMYVTTIRKVGTSLATTIPVDILRGLGWARGDTVIFTFASDDQLIIKKLSDEDIRKLKSVGDLGDEPTIQI